MPKNTILPKMLDRLFAGLASGPNLNCRPHSSRQRIDWSQFSKLLDVSPTEALRQLLSDGQATKLQARATAPKTIGKPSAGRKRTGSGRAVASPTEKPDNPDNSESADVVSPEEQQQRDNWSAQQSLLTKLRGLAEDAREYEQDTGVHVLHVGFPLLSLPPGTAGSGGSKRLLAPIAFIPVSLELRSGPHPVVAIEGLHDGADFLVPNEALFAWLERQTGQRIRPESIDSAVPATESQAESDADAPVCTATTTPSLDPWLELAELTQRVATALQLPPCPFTAESFTELRAAPRNDVDNPQAEIVPAAVLGLFPMNNQGLLRDMQSMVADSDSLPGPVQRFLSTDNLLDKPFDEDAHTFAAAGIIPEVPKLQRNVRQERLVTMADPCQGRAVRLAWECPALVIHGPPGTGKSQTITNIIGDHLARGERVLLVCDKRTALDVVARRLEHLGLGSLCALIHDPQHDQRNLYMQVREQLEELAGTSVRSRAEAQLQALDGQLQKSHDTLAKAWSLVMSPDPNRHVSFHERMGEWLEAALPSLIAAATPATADPQSTASSARRRKRSVASAGVAEPSVEPATAEVFESRYSEIRDAISRAMQIRLAEHPWKQCAGMPLETFLERPAAHIREDMAAILAAANQLDASRNDAIPAFLLPEDVEQISTPLSLPQQGAVRQELSAHLKRCLDDVDPAWRKQWAAASDATIERAFGQLREAETAIATIRSGPLDAELRMIFLAWNLSLPTIAFQIGAVDTYLQTCDFWHQWLAFGDRANANAVLQSYGLVPGKLPAQRLKMFLVGVVARMLAALIVAEQTQKNVQGAADTKNFARKTLDDGQLLGDWERLELLIQLLHDTCKLPELTGLQDRVRKTLIDADHAFVAALDSSVQRANALEELRFELTESGLFRQGWQRDAMSRLCRGESITTELQQLAGSLDSLGEILRIQALLAQFPSALGTTIERAIATSPDIDAALNAVRQQVLSDDIHRWMKSNPQLQALDGTQLDNLYREVRRLEREKQPCVRDLILDLWIRRQRERLLSATGSRLGSLGADLRRRLTTRGERAMRLRQVIAVGGKIEGGDPLFDLRPVWMASPETVAQIFPRDAMFDVVIFDEASQCRLEEALPVLTRARRVVIAGDPKQLPPTRFFESAMVTSDNADVETEQELFEAHQSQVEDLLTAALSLDIQECHLDVHYRSRNADLVEFSNQQFYGARLQAIPGHPRNRIRFAPITLYQVAGVYDERANVTEAAQVGKIVAGLLRRSQPPSIGIACFNLTQRDLILETLADLAAEDEDFAGRLATARSRVGAGAFEGLFVKNLENVQGDERDHMIISTTYGPDKQGRFYQRFGPLGQVGGGRRLNVLITRAREEVHVVTSIPAELYRNLPPIPEGRHPGGGWLLFAYLDYAERLAHEYSQWRAKSPDEAVSAPGRVVERPSRTPSHFASQLAQLIARRHNVSSDVYWGNDGFCVDVAFHHPRHPEDRTLGLLCDGTRFQYADDPIAWDVFRTTILEEQGWQLRRCWTPQFFRDPDGYIRQFLADASRIADTDPDPEGIPVEPA